MPWMDITMMIGQQKMSNSNKKELFAELRHNLYFNLSNELKLSTLKSKYKDEIIDELKTLKIIELDDLQSFESYVNYDHYLIFKYDNQYYYCDTELVPGLKMESMIKIIDFNKYLRKDKIKKIDENSSY